MTTSRTPRARRIAGAVGLVLTALLLAACGVRIDTQLNLDATGAGSRVMTLTLDEDLDALVGGPAAADASILRHKPAEVDYSGLTTGPGGELVATFTVQFASPEEYTQKVIALLAASDQEWTQENSFVVEQTRFIEGATIEEQFDSQDLLQWMFSGLLADGVVDEGSANDMFELGATTVTYDGVAYESSNQISFSELVDRGFDSVELSTAFDGVSFSRVITYWVDDKAVYSSAKEAFDGFFADVTAAGAVVEQDTEQVGVTWTASLSAESAESLVALTNAALLSEETAFAVTTGTLEGDPATSIISIVDYAECTAICSPQAPPVTESLSVPAAFQLVSGGQQDEAGRVVFPMASTGGEQVFHAVYAFASVATQLSVGLTGGMTWTGDFTVDPEAAATVGDGFESLLTGGGGADLSIETGDDGTVYTVTIQAPDAEELLKAYRTWSGYEAAGLTFADLPGANLVAVRQRVSGDLGFSGVITSHVPATGVQQTIVLPFGQSFDTEAGVMPGSATLDGSRLVLDGPGGTAFTAVASGTSLAGFVVYGVLLLAVLGLALLALLLRKQIAAAVARRREAGARRRSVVVGALPPGAPVAGERPARPHGADPVPVGGGRADAAGTDDVDFL